MTSVEPQSVFIKAGLAAVGNLISFEEVLGRWLLRIPEKAAHGYKQWINERKKPAEGGRNRMCMEISNTSSSRELIAFSHVVPIKIPAMRFPAFPEP
jgi:hypothetical protein